jgi:hypothetical protein
VGLGDYVKKSVGFTKKVVGGDYLKSSLKGASAKFGPVAGVACGPFAPLCSAASALYQQGLISKAQKKALVKLEAQQAKAMLTTDAAVHAQTGPSTGSLVFLGVAGVVLLGAVALAPRRRARA